MKYRFVLTVFVGFNGTRHRLKRCVTPVTGESQKLA